MSLEVNDTPPETTDVMKPNLDELLEAAQAVVRAEWEFRVGPRAYKGETNAWFEDSMNVLREVLTGETDLNAAGIILGKGKAKEKATIPRLRMPNRSKLQPNLFDE